MYTKTQKTLKFDITYADLAFGNYNKFCIRNIKNIVQGNTNTWTEI